MTPLSSNGRLSRNRFLRALALGTPLLPATLASSSARADDLDLGNFRSFVELARADVRTQKALIIAQNIDFTADEAVEFWPLHLEYEIELGKLLDQRYEGILQFAKEYGTMSDTEATGLARKSFDIEQKRTDLKRKYFKKFSKVVPAVKAARFFQIENQLNMAIDLRLAATLPLIK